MSDTLLFTPIQVGTSRLSNRVVMAPMTRSRAGAGDAATDDEHLGVVAGQGGEF